MVRWTVRKPPDLQSGFQAEEKPNVLSNLAAEVRSHSYRIVTRLGIPEVIDWLTSNPFNINALWIVALRRLAPA
jgi:hypothetical protein